VLVSINHHSTFQVEELLLDKPFPLDSTLKKMVGVSLALRKESGVYPLCIARWSLQWSFKTKLVNSPLWLVPCEVRIDKATNTVQLLPQEDIGFINPFLTIRLKQDFDVEIPAEVNTAEELATFLGQKKIGEGVEKVCFLGNFHHHRFEIVKELDELKGQQASPSIAHLLGDESAQNALKMPLSSGNLFPADRSQMLVFETVQTQDTLVQGPPGTGKSQVLTNILAKLLRKNLSALVVSEKRVALDVIRKKLHVFELSDLCFTVSSETISKDALMSLKKSWLRLEQQEVRSENYMQLSEQYVNQLQLQLDLLNQPSLIGGMSFIEFTNYSASYSLENTEGRTDLPMMQEWVKATPCVKEIYTQKIQDVISSIQLHILKQDAINQLDVTVRRLLEQVKDLNRDFSIRTFSDLHNAMKVAALCQHFSNASFRRFAHLFHPESKEQQRFLRLHKKWIQAKKEQVLLENEQSVWKQAPSLLETEHLWELLKNQSYFGQWRFKKQWKNYAHISKDKASEVLNQRRHYLAKNNEITQIEIKFCELGINLFPQDVEYVNSQLQSVTPTDWATWLALPEKNRHLLAGKNQQLYALYSELKAYFKLEAEDFITQKLHAVLNHFDVILSLRHLLPVLTESICNGLKYCDSFEELDACVCKSNWIRFTVQFPAFSQFNSADLLKKCHEIIREQDTESTQLAALILAEQAKKFKNYHKLLQTPVSKLNPTEKRLKERLKKGKAILVREFSKTKRFISIRELVSSEANEWVQLLKPIWLTNPVQIAKCFPMQQGLFDVAIFDEASQIPLQNALGTIQRAKRILVAGDSQQMGPASYFKVQSGEQTDLLHQASFYWKNTALNHHYRSENPALIQFSNTHFYGNKLIAFPSANREKKSIKRHFCNNGIYDERQNKVEAKMVATFLEQHIHSDETLGVVAFSEIQLDKIWQKLSDTVREQLELRIAADTAFFKALENVQGDECDHLIISLGYAKNDAGEFHHRFGPLNTQNGSKRLNVLLTRARKNIDFFTSVHASDFNISTNESVNLLRLWLLHLESNELSESEIKFPYNVEAIIKGNSLKISNVYSTLKNAHELITFVRVMEERGWSLIFNSVMRL
jgi:hypothetical protein